MKEGIQCIVTRKVGWGWETGIPMATVTSLDGVYRGERVRRKAKEKGGGYKKKKKKRIKEEHPNWVIIRVLVSIYTASPTYHTVADLQAIH